MTDSQNFNYLIYLWIVKSNQSQASNALQNHEDHLRTLFLEYSRSSEAAFNQLHHELAPKVISYLRKRLRREEDVAEVYQGFFAKLHRSRTQYNPENPFIPWVYSMLKSEVLDFVKISGRHQKKLEAVFLDQMSQNRELVSSNYTNKEQDFEELLVQLGLQPEARELLRMRFVEDMSTKEMSERLQIKEPTLRKRLSRLMESVKTGVESEERSQDEG